MGSIKRSLLYYEICSDRFAVSLVGVRFHFVALFMQKSVFFQVEMVEEFEPGKASYNDMLLKVKDCQARVYFLYAR